jgi:hypothetical protein
MSLFIIWLNSTQQNYEKNYIEFNLNQIIMYSIEISMKILTMLNPKEKNIMFSSITSI